MTAAYIVIIAVLLLATVFAAVASRRNIGGVNDACKAQDASCATCGGAGGSCLKARILEASHKEIEYFDDEELDAFKGRDADGYTDEETEQFADIMHTMRREEVKDWLTSLWLRGIKLPDRLKEEAVMLTKAGGRQ